MGPPSVELTGIHYNGATLFADWQANIGPGFDYFQWTVFDLDSPWKQVGKTTTTRIEQAIELNTDTAYQVYVVMYADEQPVATSQIEFVITQRPIIDKMVYAIGSLAIRWPELTQTGVAKYVVSTDSTGGSHENHNTDTNSITIDQTFNTSFVWTSAVSGRTFSGISTGPQSVARTMVLQPPVLTGVSYDLTKTIAGWVPLEQAGAQGFVATLIGDTTSRWETDDFTIVIPGARDPQYTWLLSVAAESLDGVVIGPSSQQVTLILAAPSLDELDYDSAKLTPRWTKVAPTSADGYLVQLDDAGELNNYEAGDVSEIIIDIELSVVQTYYLWVMATKGIVAGPISNRLTPLTKPATQVCLDTDLTVQPLIANWTKPNGGETGFLLQLSRNGVVQPDITAMPPFVFPQPLEAGVMYQLRLRPTGDRVKGPWSALVPGPWLAAIVCGYDQMARLHTMSWNGTATRTWSYDDAGNVLTVATIATEDR